MKLFLLFALFALAFAQNKTDNTTKKEPLNANLAFKDDFNWSTFPFIRAAHPVVAGVENKNRDGEMLNFCGNEYGFDIKDFERDCFFKPYLYSILLPTILIFVLSTVFLISALVFISIRKKCGGCCRATEGFICGGSRKKYEFKDWLIYFILTVVFVVVLQIPFFLVGIIGNSTMTVSLKKISSDVFKVTTEFDGLGNMAKDAFGKFNETATQEFDKFAKNQTEASTKESGENMMTTLKNIGNDVVDILTAGDNFLTTFINWFLIGREVLFDVVLIVPLLGSVVFIISGIFKISVLAWIFFPFMIIFSYISLLFVAIEFPFTTIVADVCVAYRYAEKYVDFSETTDVANGENVNFTAMSTSDALTELFKVPIHCNQSLFNNLTYVANGFIDFLYDTMFEGVNLTFIDEIENVCNGTTVTGVFYEYNNTFDCPYNDSKCVYELSKNTTKAEIDATIVYEPLLICQDPDPNNNITNKLEAFVENFQQIPYMSVTSPRVYWIKTTSYLTEAAKEGAQIAESELKNIANIIEEEIEEFIGDIVPEDFNLNLKLSSNPTTRSNGGNSMKSDRLIEPTDNWYCADLDGNIYTTGDNPVRNTTLKKLDMTDGTYFMTRIECGKSAEVQIVECKEGSECPEVYATLLTPIATGPIADTIIFLKSVFDVIRGILDLVDKLESVFT